MVEFQADAKVNSGVFLRTPLEPTDPKSDCIELNIAPVDNPFPTASLVGRSRVEPDVVGPLEEEAWHTFHALLDGDHIQIWIDGKQVVDYVDTTRLVAGRIGLQFREGTVRFKNIRLRPILLNTMLPAQDLSQWQPSKTPSAFQLDKDGVLHIEKAKEAIEFLQPLQNFCFQTSSKRPNEWLPLRFAFAAPSAMPRKDIAAGSAFLPTEKMPKIHFYLPGHCIRKGRVSPSAKNKAGHISPSQHMAGTWQPGSMESKSSIG